MKKETISKRRKEIFEAALKVFSKYGFHKASMDQIAELMKISKPALYLYFKNKESLFFSMIENKMLPIGQILQDILKTKQTSIDKLKEVITRNIKFFIINIEFFQILHRTIINLTEEKKSKFHKGFIRGYGNYIRQFEKLIKQCIKDGHLRKTDSLFLTFSLMGMMNQSVFGTMIVKKPSYLKNISLKVIDLFLQGAQK